MKTGARRKGRELALSVLFAADVGRLGPGKALGALDSTLRALMEQWEMDEEEGEKLAPEIRHFGLALAEAYFADGQLYSARRYYERIAERAEQTAYRGFAGRAASRLVVREGDPALVLPRMATEVGADLVAIGIRQHRGAVGLLLGSRADALLRSSTVPVLSVPALLD